MVCSPIKYLKNIDLFVLIYSIWHHGQVEHFKTGYWLGVTSGFFIYSFNSTTKRFQSSKNIKIYNSIVVTLGAAFSVGILYAYQTVMNFDNMVIQIATPMNIIALSTILMYGTAGARFREQGTLEMLNTALDISEVVEKNGRKLNFAFVLFSRTFLIDFISIVMQNLSLSRDFILHGGNLTTYIIFVAQSGKIGIRLFTHFNICAINYSIHLLDNVKTNMTKSC